MYSAFNMDIGFVIVADETNSRKILEEIEAVQIIGKIVPGSAIVKLV